MISKKIFPAVLIFVTVIISVNYFELRYIVYQGSIFKSIRFLALILIVILSLNWIPQRTNGFIIPIKLIIFSIAFSFLTALFSWHQEFIDTLISTLPYMLWFFFFFLLKVKISVRKIEQAITILGVIYTILFFIQLSIYPTILFSFADELSSSRGIDRMVFPGGGVFFLTVFISLSKLKNKAGYRWFWITFLVLGIAIPILQVTRQYIVAILLIYFLHFTRGVRFIHKVIFSILLIGLTVAFFTSENKLIQGMLLEQQRNMEQGTEYVRILSAKYYLFDFSPNVVNRIFGNGVPYGNKTEYGKSLNSIRESDGYHYNDVGLIGIYAFFGILAVIGYLLIGFKSIAIPLPSQFYYLKYYLWFIFMTSLTSSLLFNYHFLITNVLVIYCYQILSENRLIQMNLVKKHLG